MFFHIFQPDVMLSLCLHFEQFQPIYSYKGYAYKKRVQCKTIC